MFITKMSGMFSSITVWYYTLHNFVTNRIFWWNRKINPVYKYSFIMRLTIMHMVRMIFKKFKIFKSIVMTNAINMMDLFFSSKWSTNNFSHNNSMFKNPFVIYGDSHISIFI